MSKDSPSAPAPPDPVAVAQAQLAANKEAALVTARLNNPNTVNPYGKSTTRYGADAFYANNPAAAEQYRKESYGLSPEDFAKMYSKDRLGMINAYDEYTPYVTQELDPYTQITYDKQKELTRQLTDLSKLGAKTATDIMGTPYRYEGPGANFTFDKGGAISQGPDASAFTAGAGPNATQFKAGAGPSAANFMAGGAPNFKDYLAGKTLNTTDIAKMPINSGTTAQQAIMARLDPQIARNRVSTETQLINQGLRPGSEAYNNAINLLGQQENDQRTQAVLQGLGLDMSANAQGYNQALSTGQFGNLAQAQNFGQGLAGQSLSNQAQAQNFGQGNIQQQLYNQAQGQNFGQGVTAQNVANQAAGQNYTQNYNTIAQNNAAQQQLYAQNLQRANFENAARQQSLQNDIAERQMPLNEINALRSGTQIVNPQFSPYTGANVGAAPIAQTMQNAYAGQMNAYNQDVASQNAQTKGLFDLGAAALPYLPGFSDRRLKSNITRIGTHPLGIGIYEYDIFDRHEIGVMAQEVQQVLPEAIHIHPSGFMMVDYGRLNA
jgi:DNA-binding transcriptional regulator YiaG